MRLRTIPAALTAATGTAFAQAPPSEPPPTSTPLSALSLEQVMRDPDWIARSPERPWWSDDATALYYSRKREGSEARDTWRLPIAFTAGAPTPGDAALLTDAQRLVTDSRAGDLSRDRSRKVFARNADVFLKDLETGVERQLTRTAAAEFGARFTSDERRVLFQRDGVVLARDVESGLEEQLLDLRFADEPKDRDDKPDFLRAQQERLFETVRAAKSRRDASRQDEKSERAARDALAPPIVYMGAELESRGVEVSPDGAWAVVRAVKKSSRDAKRDVMPTWVTDDGYVRSGPLRTKVGTVERRAEELYLIDLRPGVADRRTRLDLGVLPGIADDPLAAIRAANTSPEPAPPDAKPGDAPPKPESEAPQGTPSGPRQAKAKELAPRPASVREVAWSPDGARCVLQVVSLDNKDRWIASVDLDAKRLTPIERLSDEAWINGRFAELGWIDASPSTLWYTSERSGFAQLYSIDLASPGATPRRITGAEHEGRYEVSGVHPSRDGTRFYFTANIERPGVYELYRIDAHAESAGAERLTTLAGENDFLLSPDERRVAILHSDTITPPELYVQSLDPPSPAVRVTATVSPEYAGVQWLTPRVVAVPSRAGAPVWSRVYALPAPAGARRPCVVFVHGAGYLQDADEGWSNYFREHMFHNILAQRGYVVIAPDYRASAGYGRDWRTAIYRRMGTPELDDVQDCIDWLAREEQIDPARVGIYGGSYGGFLTLMALFTRPDSFASGAALRPVTDWAHYSDDYTANILNTPEIDPDAYRRSSPIEHAEGLRAPLLICHGMLDDNVFFQDTVRLVQRLIELKKERWEVAVYPVEPHGFREATSWLDEYRRIDALFRRTLEPAPVR
jgi:dipeptidyl aminopeptidase/acylaminoacyl peptidase